MIGHQTSKAFEYRKLLHGTYNFREDVKEKLKNVNYANTGKLSAIDSLITEYNRIVNEFIDYLWNNGVCMIKRLT